MVITGFTTSEYLFSNHYHVNLLLVIYFAFDQATGNLQGKGTLLKLQSGNVNCVN